jgi:hypothetical protein
VSKQRWADIVFGLQILLLVISCTIQGWHMIFRDIYGLNLATYFGSWISMFLQFTLAIGAHRQLPSRSSRQTVTMYSFWLVFFGSHNVIIVRYLLCDPSYWDYRDNVTMALIVSGLLVTWRYGRGAGLALDDPRVNGLMSVCLRMVPNLAIAWKVYFLGGSGYSPYFVTLGHALILSRVFAVAFLRSEAGWDLNRRIVLRVELGNEFVWIVATAVWLRWFFT